MGDSQATTTELTGPHSRLARVSSTGLVSPASRPSAAMRPNAWACGLLHHVLVVVGVSDGHPRAGRGAHTSAPVAGTQADQSVWGAGEAGRVLRSSVPATT